MEAKSKKDVGIITFLIENSVFLILGSLVALIWVNIDNSSYNHAAHSIHFVVNDILMAFFFLLAGKEIRESMLPGGALSNGKTAALPIMATIGGMLFPATIYFVGAKLFDPSFSSGWAIPMATDIAFCYLVARMIFPKTSEGKQHPAILFLLLLAIADDAGGLIILAAFYPSAQSDMVMFAVFVIQGVLLALLLWKVMRVKSFWPYLIIAGPFLWFGFYQGGIHPALALVPLAWLMPHEHSDLGIWAPGESERQDTLNKMEHWWKTPVELFLGLFGFVNAGVEVSGFGVGTVLVLAGLFIGKPLGIYLMTRLGQSLGMKLPEGMNNNDVLIVGFAAAIGFTVALFVSVVAFPAGPMQDSVKMGALLSFLAAPLTIFIAKFLEKDPQKNSSTTFNKKKSTAQ